jgi:hypothetical protein
MTGQPIQPAAFGATEVGAIALNAHAQADGVTDSGYTDEEENVITKPLAALGYVI